MSAAKTGRQRAKSARQPLFTRSAWGGLTFDPLWGMDATSPGPSTYNYNMDGVTAHRASTERVFNNLAPRFDEKAAERNALRAPGPGSYVIPSTLNAALEPVKKPVKTQLASVDLLHHLQETSTESSAPSIPRKGQSYGYETDEHGRLVLQDLQIPGYSGVRADTVGPGDYNPSLDFLTGKDKPRSAFFPQSPRHPVATDPSRMSFTPGPGAYKHASTFDGSSSTGHGQPAGYKGDYLVRLSEVNMAKPNAVFESRSIRDVFGNQIRSQLLTPGPQRYHLPSSIKVQHKPIQNQFFDTKEERFRSARTQANTIDTAPGDYDPLTNDIDKMHIHVDKRKHISKQSAFASTVAFDNTERRFNDINCGLPKDKVFNKLPPPGAYDPRTEFVHSLAKVNPHPTGPFGCQDARFRKPKDWRSAATAKPKKQMRNKDDKLAILAAMLEEDGKRLYPNSLPSTSTAGISATSATSSATGLYSYTLPATGNLSHMQTRVALESYPDLQPAWGTAVAVPGLRGGSMPVQGPSFPQTLGRSSYIHHPSKKDFAPPSITYHKDAPWPHSKNIVKYYTDRDGQGRSHASQSRKVPEEPSPGPGRYSQNAYTITQAVEQHGRKHRVENLGSTAERTDIVPKHTYKVPGHNYNITKEMRIPSHNVFIEGMEGV